MNENAKTIILLLQQYLEQNPSIRFTQALHNLNINQFANLLRPEIRDNLLRDTYNDTDEQVVKRMTA